MNDGGVHHSIEQVVDAEADLQMRHGYALQARVRRLDLLRLQLFDVAEGYRLKTAGILEKHDITMQRLWNFLGLYVKVL